MTTSTGTILDPPCYDAARAEHSERVLRDTVRKLRSGYGAK